MISDSIVDNPDEAKHVSTVVTGKMFFSSQSVKNTKRCTQKLNIFSRSTAI